MRELGVRELGVESEELRGFPRTRDSNFISKNFANFADESVRLNRCADSRSLPHAKCAKYAKFFRRYSYFANLADLA